MTRFKLSLCALLLTLALPQTASAGTEVKWKNVEDPILGSALFHLYQDKNLGGIIELSAAQQLDKVKLQKEEAELAITMLNLAYGLHREAASTMVALQKRGDVNKDISNHIWFYIAKIRYQRGYFTMAESALSQISGALPWELDQDLKLFKATLLMDRNEHASANTVLRRLKGSTGAVPFARFNQAVTLLNQEQPDEAYQALEGISDLEHKNEQEKNLYDRANVHLGYYHLRDKDDPKKAIQYFEKVHLYALESNEALLGLGWAHYQLEEYDRALIAWEELATRNASDPNVQEAMIAVPFTLAKNENYDSAAELYNRALNAFHNELKRVDDTIGMVKRGTFFDKLLTDIDEGEKGWKGDVYALPKSTESYYFTQMLARHDYQEALKNYRDLRYLEKKLTEWQFDVETFDNTNHYWINNLLDQTTHFDQQAFLSKIEKLRQRRTDFMAQLATVEADQDAMALANDTEQRQLAMITRLKNTLKLQEQSAETQRHQRQLSLLERRILWDIYSQFSSRLRKAKIDLEGIVSTLDEAIERKKGLEISAKLAAMEARQFDKRVIEVKHKIKALQPQISSAITDTEAHLISIAVTALEERREQLMEFIAQVSFSVGVSYDREQ